MDDKPKVYTPEVIPDAGFPLEGTPTTAVTSSTQQTTNQTFGAKEMAEQGFPLKMVAKELMSTAINTITKKITKAFEFTKSGALQIGEYINGVSGDIRISPDGITARNNAGNTTFSLDGDTGDAIFTGDVRASTFTSDFFNVDERGNVRASSLELSTASVSSFSPDQYQVMTSSSTTDIPGLSKTLAFDRGTMVMIMLNLNCYLFAGAGTYFEGMAYITISDGSTILSGVKLQGGRDATQGTFGGGGTNLFTTVSTHYIGAFPAGTHTLKATAEISQLTGTTHLWIDSARLSIVTLGNG